MKKVGQQKNTLLGYYYTIKQTKKLSAVIRIRILTGMISMRIRILIGMTIVQLRILSCTTALD